jgi:hypothetical protein
VENQTINNLDYPARRIVVMGTTRTGKTTLAARLAHSHPAPLVLIFDWQGGEFASRLGEKVASTREELAAQIDSGRRVICYYPYHIPEKNIEEWAEEFDWFSAMVFELAGKTPGRKLFVIDEAQDVMDPWNVPDGLSAILTKGGRRMIDTCVLSRSGNAINTVGRDQVNEVYCFRLTDDNSLKYPKALGMDPEEVKTLKDTHFIYRNTRTGEEKKLALWDRKANGS